ncbi:hypothetical protein AMK19_09595 [Kitasatospora sp. CB01950]|nr:hypothetical protein AMK19_09595 [Kitasatospora sp. CB01950]
MITMRAPQLPLVPNLAMRELRGNLSPREFATKIRRAAKEIGEHVSCDARYVGRVEAGEIRCPNYAYRRVFRHMWPEKSLADLGFAPRRALRHARLSVSATHLLVRGVGVAVTDATGRGFALFEVEPDAPQSSSGPPDARIVLVQDERSERWDLPGASWATDMGEHPAAITTRHVKDRLGIGLPVSPTLLDVGPMVPGGMALVFDGGTIRPVDALLMRPLSDGEYSAVRVARTSELPEMDMDQHVTSRILRALANKHTGCGIPPPVK